MAIDASADCEFLVGRGAERINIPRLPQQELGDAAFGGVVPVQADPRRNVRQAQNAS